MNKFKFICLIFISSLVFFGCQSVSKKIDEKTTEEERELSKWLNKPETELKIVYGQPDKVEFLGTECSKSLLLIIQMSAMIPQKVAS